MNKFLYFFAICTLSCLSIFFLSGCQNDPNPEDLPIANIGLVNDGRQSGTLRIQLEVLEGTNPTAILDWGICNNNNIDPTIEDNIFSCGSGIYSGSKLLKIRDLGITEPGDYSLRVYATNSYGTAYSANYSLALVDADFIPFVSLSVNTSTTIVYYASPQCGTSIIDAGIYFDENPGITSSDYYFSAMDILDQYDQGESHLLYLMDIISGSPFNELGEGDKIYLKGYVKNSDGVEIFTEEKVHTTY